LDSKIDAYSQQMKQLNEAIERDKRKFKRTEKGWGHIKGTEESSLTMFSNFQENYKYKYMQNVGLGVGIAALLWLIHSYQKGSGSGSGSGP
jgi:ferric-dicitrate binding protein FerR (iron transport regulator)